jgi:hypothetical protein
MTGRLFWILVGAAAVFAWAHWDEIRNVYENRKAVGAGAKAVNAVQDFVDASKTLYHEVTQ